MPFASGSDALARFVNVLLALVLSITVLYFGRDLFILLVVSGLFAFLLLPFARRMERSGCEAGQRSRIRLGAGAVRPFQWYLEGPSEVAPATLDELLEWLMACEYVHDSVLFQVEDYWQHPRTFEQLRKGDCEDHALWAWRKLAEICQKYLRKGSQIYVEGKLQTRSWDDKESGQKRYMTEIKARDMRMLGGRPDGARSGGAAPAAPEPPMDGDPDDSVPF